LSAEYVSVYIYVDSCIFGLYVTFHSKLCRSKIISIYVWHFDQYPLLSMKRGHVIEVSQWQASLQLIMPLS